MKLVPKSGVFLLFSRYRNRWPEVCANQCKKITWDSSTGGWFYPHASLGLPSPWQRCWEDALAGSQGGGAWLGTPGCWDVVLPSRSSPAASADDPQPSAPQPPRPARAAPPTVSHSLAFPSFPVGNLSGTCPACWWH